MGLKSYVTESIALQGVKLRQRLNSKFDNDPFGSEPRASEEDYMKLFEEARNRDFPAISALEEETGYAIDTDWLDDLALHTQVVVKSYKGSVIAYPHGRLLYSLLRKMIADNGHRFVNIVETGTARGFSALCMAKAIQDAGIDGRIFTIDLLPHVKPIFWNCIDDHKGRHTRSQLLEPWADLKKHIVFLQGNTLDLVPSLGVDRVHFAFLDARHIEVTVMAEFETVENRQVPGDMIFFDDVTPAMFPGVVKAVKRIEEEGNYAFERLSIGKRRAYAWATRTR